MYYPSRELFEKKASDANLIPVYREFLADKETPVSIFLKTDNGGENAFLLENVEGCKKWGRYSFIGASSKATFRSNGIHGEILENGMVRRIKGNSINILEKFLSAYRPAEVAGLPKFYGGAVGYIRYDAAKDFRVLPRTSLTGTDPWSIFFILTDSLIVFDKLNYKIKVIVNAYIQDGNNLEEVYNNSLNKIDNLIERLKTETIPFRHIQPPTLPTGPASNISKEGFILNAFKTRLCDRVGETSHIDFPRELGLHSDTSPFNLYRILRTVTQNQYMFYMRCDNFILIGLSTETISKIKDPFNAIREGFPTETPSDALKVMSKEWAEPFKQCKRNPYSDSVGYIGFSGNMDMAVNTKPLILMYDKT